MRGEFVAAREATHQQWRADVRNQWKLFRCSVKRLWSRESVMIETAARLNGVSVAQALEKWVARHGVPTSITVDHGTEFTSKALEAWAWGGVLTSISLIRENPLKTDT